MGNIISFFIYPQKREITEPIEEKEIGDVKIEKIDFQPIKQNLDKLDKLFKNLEIETNTKLIKNIETNLLNFYNSTLQTCSNLILSQPYLNNEFRVNSSLPFDELFENYVNYCNENNFDAEPIINQIKLNFEQVSKKCIEEFDNLRKEIISINKNWKEIYDGRVVNTNIQKMIDENPDYSADFDFSMLEEVNNKISEILNESDRETEEINSITFTNNLFEIIQTISESFTNFYDLFDDEEELKKLNIQLTDIKIQLTEHIKNNKYQQELKEDIDNKFSVINNWIVEVRNKKDRIDLFVNDQKGKFEEISKFEDDYKQILSIKEEIDQYGININQLEDAKVSYDKYIEIYNKLFQSGTVIYLDEQLTEFINKYIKISEYPEEILTYYITMQQIYENVFSLWDSFDTNKQELQNSYNEFMSIYSMLINDFQIYFNSLTETYNNQINEWLRHVDDYQEILKNNYELIQQNQSTITDTTIKTSQIELYRTILEGNISIINDCYYESFLKDNSFYVQFRTQLEIYRSISANSSIISIVGLINCFKKVNSKMINIDSRIQQSNEKFKESQETISLIQQLIDEEKERLVKLEKMNVYDAEYGQLKLIMKDEYNSLNSIITNLDSSLQNISGLVSELNKYFASPFDELLMIDEVYKNNDYASKVVEEAEDSNNKYSEFQVYVSSQEAEINNFKDILTMKISLIRDIHQQATIEDIDQRISINQISSSLSQIDVDDYENRRSNIEKTVLEIVEKYSEIITTVMTCYDIVPSISPDLEVRFRENQLQLYQETLDIYNQKISNFQETFKHLQSKLIETSNYVYCRYVELFNSIIVILDNSKSIEAIHNLNNSSFECKNYLYQFEDGSTSSISTYFQRLINVWNNNSKYLQGVGSDYANQFNSFISIIRQKINEIGENSKVIDSYIVQLNEYGESIDLNIESFNNEYINFQTNKNTLLSSQLQEMYSIIKENFNECQKTINKIVNLDFEAIQIAANDIYLQIIKIIQDKLGNLVDEVSTMLSENRTNILRFKNAAKLLSYIFGHYRVGLHKRDEFMIDNQNWKSWLKNEICECLYPSDGSLEVTDVFDTLCFYPPILPLIWPYGNSDVEMNIQKVEDLHMDYGLLSEYIREVLPNYIYFAIVNTMDKSSLSPLEQQINKEVVEVSVDQSKLEEYKIKQQKSEEILIEIEKYRDIQNSNSDAGLIDAEIFNQEFSDNELMNNSRKAYENATRNIETLTKQYSQLMKEIEEIQINNENIDTNEEIETVKSNYFIKFINESFNIATDTSITNKESAFIRICKDYLDVDPEIMNIHSYWKLLRLASGKFRNGENNEVVELIYEPTLFPNNFPIINPDAELKEAIIIILNRIFSTLGYPTETYSSIESGPQRITWDSWINKDINSSIIPGGQCIGYTNKSYYNNQMGKTYIKDEFTSNITTNDNSLYQLENLSKCIRTEKYAMYGTTNFYLKFVNPTAMFDYLFNDRESKFGSFDSLSIDNFCHDFAQDTNQSINNLIDVIFVSITQNVDFHKNNYKLSPEYIYDEIVTNTVYQHIFSFIQNWKLIFPYFDYSQYNGINNVVKQYIPISKINSVTFHKELSTTNGIRNFGTTIYQIFENKGSITNAEIDGDVE